MNVNELIKITGSKPVESFDMEIEGLGRLSMFHFCDEGGQTQLTVATFKNMNTHRSVLVDQSVIELLTNGIDQEDNAQGQRLLDGGDMRSYFNQSLSASESFPYELVRRLFKV